MALNDVVQSFRTGTYSVSRTPVGIYVQGVLIAGSPTVLSVIASVVPTQGRKIVVDEEGKRQTATKTLYTTTVMQLGDVVTVDGEPFAVVDLKEWEGFDLDMSANLWECFLARQVIP